MIHKEGRTLLFVLLIIFSGINYAIAYFLPSEEFILQLVMAVCLVLYLLVLQFFRNPTRKVDNISDNLIIAPADGKVVVIEDAEESEYFNDKRKQISIFMSPINVHVNRMPISGIIQYFKYHQGKYLVAWHPKSSTENERTTTVVKTANGTEVLFRQIAGAVARRIKWYIKEKQKLVQGEEFGFIKFGSRVDLFLPLDAKIKVNIDDKTVGGKTVIAELK
ncbi:MAG: phosphatidylserine decarboxylase family protein [Cyclobacteriaceae bacterium]|nr:phosphatidylserine decarboxylase family protein [Cyclobacteriaceae bacterium]